MSLTPTANTGRYERKYSIDPIYPAREVIAAHPALFSEVYYQRQVNSVYFDTSSLQFFHDNIDGASTRVKVRVRWYGLFDEITLPQLELKYKQGEVIFKQVVPLAEQCSMEDILSGAIFHQVSMNILAQKSQLLQPVVANSYQRRYFLSHDQLVRATLDTHINYRRVRGQQISQFPREPEVQILELKYATKPISNPDDTAAVFDLKLDKYSKYEQGVVLTHSQAV